MSNKWWGWVWGGVGISTYRISRDEGWERLKLKSFLRNEKKMEKVTSDGCSFSTRKYVSLSKTELDRSDVILSKLLFAWNRHSFPVYFSFFTKMLYPRLYFILVINSP